MGFTKRDSSFWRAVIVAVVIFAVFVAVMFLPLIETDICTSQGECADTKILKSYFEILTGK